ncbi:hypothetical protein SAMN04488522_101947 [Pedobacter caeni]|uniref:Uncharacterized protein n=1 Tax=Pedobacter caeni TaxID=288992 RepID=A0A1M4VLR2_9SPHI|nr:hypothetical protein SAMN04488522_101947 [Pedobacter caeni]
MNLQNDGYAYDGAGTANLRYTETSALSGWRMPLLKLYVKKLLSVSNRNKVALYICDLQNIFIFY